jgi:16S rRNA processing protein RimM
MAYTKHIMLGKITKIHGYEGAVIIRLERTFSDNIPEMESVFIEIDGRPVPFFIDYSELNDPSTLRLRFSGYNSADKVKEFVGCKLFLTGESISALPVGNPQSLLDYKVFSNEDISIGIISEIIENPDQLLLNVINGTGKNILVPLHEDLIKELDTEKKIIRMIIPDGISDIN